VRPVLGTFQARSFTKPEGQAWTLMGRQACSYYGLRPGLGVAPGAGSRPGLNAPRPSLVAPRGQVQTLGGPEAEPERSQQGQAQAPRTQSGPAHAPVADRPALLQSEAQPGQPIGGRRGLFPTKKGTGRGAVSCLGPMGETKGGGGLFRVSNRRTLTPLVR
jgi:hypothetical protein